MEEDWVVLCQALYQSIGKEEWSDMHHSFFKKKEGCKNIGVQKAGWTYTKHYVLVKIATSKSQLLNLRGFRLTEFVTLGLVSCLSVLLKVVSSSHRCLLSSTIVRDEFDLLCPFLDARQCRTRGA